MRIYQTFLSLVAACFYFSGFVPLMRWVAATRSRPHVVILNYHRAAIGDLGAHLRYLRRHYRSARSMTPSKISRSPAPTRRRAHQQRPMLRVVIVVAPGHYV